MKSKTILITVILLLIITLIVIIVLSKRKRSKRLKNLTLTLQGVYFNDFTNSEVTIKLNKHVTTLK